MHSIFKFNYLNTLEIHTQNCCYTIQKRTDLRNVLFTFVGPSMKLYQIYQIYFSQVYSFIQKLYAANRKFIDTVMRTVFSQHITKFLSLFLDKII